MQKRIKEIKIVTRLKEKPYSENTMEEIEHLKADDVQFDCDRQLVRFLWFAHGVRE